MVEVHTSALNARNKGDNMKVTINLSAEENIDEKYKLEAKKVSDFLAMDGCDLNWGSGSISLMGVVYEEFLKYNRNIYGYTSFKYIDDVVNLEQANTHRVYDSTFKLKEALFEAGDFLLVLPGGTGTISELFGYLEELRSNDKNKPLIIYNESHHFDEYLSLIDDLVKRHFNDRSIYKYFKVANTFEEFVEIYKQIKNNQLNN